MPLLIKLRLLTNPAYLKKKVLVKARKFFTELLDIKPRNAKDYYPVFRWLVSKRLAFALVIGLGLLAALYISTILPEGFFGGKAGAVPTYRYRSIPLEFHSGAVKIKGKGGYIAYEGDVKKGVVVGKGTLYAADGSTVYQGDFADNRYNGKGIRFYPNGTPRYQGDFVDNMFHGQGQYFRPNGVMEYDGGYTFDVRNGEGILYNGVGSEIFTGNFQNGSILYPDFLGRPTSEAANMYTGKSEIYQSDKEYCVTMPEINALYSVKDGSNTLENEWTVDQVLVKEQSISLDGNLYSDINGLKEYFGNPLYFGTAWVTLPESVAWNQLAEVFPDRVRPVEVTSASSLEGVHSVSNYNSDAQVYLYTFEQEGLLYTFYFTGAGESEFIMYAIEQA